MTFDRLTQLLVMLHVRAAQLGLTRFATAEGGDWVHATGPRGGSIWTHSGTGAKKYQKNKPGGGKAAKEEPAVETKPSARTKAKAAKEEWAGGGRAAMPAKAGPALEGHVLDEIGSLLKREFADDGMVPIHELRRRVAQKFGGQAASPAVFDRLLKDLRFNDKVRLVAISDNSQATPAQLAGSVPGDNETFFSVAPVQPAAEPDPNESRADGGPAVPAPKQAPAKSDHAHGRDVLAALSAADGLERTDDLRSRMPAHLRGEAFDRAVLALNDAGLVDLSREASAESLAGRAVVRDGHQAFATMSLTDAGREALKGSAAPAAKPATPKPAPAPVSKPAGRPGAGLRSLRPPVKPKAPHPLEAAVRQLLPGVDAATLADPDKLVAAIRAAHAPPAKKAKAPAKPRAKK